MKDLYIDSEKHEYYWQGEKKPCVSDILKMVDVIAMDGIPVRNIEKAGERGKKIHEQTELYDLGMLDLTDDEWWQENEEISGYVMAYISFRKDNPQIPVAIEESLYSEELDLCGTIDRVFMFNGVGTILDIKSSNTISELRNTLQLNFYRKIWNETQSVKIESLKILQLKDNGEYRLIPIETNEGIAIDWLSKYKQIKGDKKL